MVRGAWDSLKVPSAMYVTLISVEVWFQPTAYTAGEATGTITVTIKTNLAGGPEDGSVVFTTVNGSATGKNRTSSDQRSL